MMCKWIKYCVGYLAILGLTACSPTVPESAEQVDEYPSIYPDYINVAIPQNIAPLNFYVKHEGEMRLLIGGKEHRLCLKDQEGAFNIPLKKWRNLLKENVDESLALTIFYREGNAWKQFKPFYYYIKKDKIDSHLVYRLIPPAFRLWNQMGIYQRNLESFEETPLLMNRMTDHNCMNCHTFSKNNPQRMLFHQRSSHPGTYLAHSGKLSKLSFNLPDKVGVRYMNWDPSARYLVFSTNDVKQDYHYADPNRIEVFDSMSDIYLYDMEKGITFTDSLLCSKDVMETFPAFSSDGKKILFCSAENHLMPEEYRQVKYNLLSIDFNPETGSLGDKVDTLYNAHKEGRSAKFPRVSPDGHYLLYTLSDYGNFSIWHKDADLKLYDIVSGKEKNIDAVNSKDTESYHSWSSNSRWFVFSSRRDDGSYTRPYFAYIDYEGNVSKPFVLPQKDPKMYEGFLLSYNIPELVQGEVEGDAYLWAAYTRKQP